MNTNVHYGCYGPNYNVRDCYKDLPFQFFWTWVTGKGQVLSSNKLKACRKFPPIHFVIAHLVYTWGLLLLAIYIGAQALLYSTNIWLTLAIVILAQIIVVNRLRSLQASFHYLTHGSMIKNKRLARRIALNLITTPLLYIDWDNYKRSHVKEHHQIDVLCTSTDPDQLFIIRQHFRKHMPENEFWLRALFTPFKPSYLFNEWLSTFKDCFIKPSAMEIAYRLIFWLCIIALVITFQLEIYFLLFFIIPRFILFPHSMWLQLFTEHLWLADAQEGETRKSRYGKLTWGRFQGRAIPQGFFKKTIWLLKVFVLDIPVRIYVYPQDLPNHDFHHRYPGIAYRNIADVRATMEYTVDNYGPYLETWGFFSTLKLIRDHICFDRSDLFLPYHFNNQCSEETHHGTIHQYVQK